MSTIAKVIAVLLTVLVAGCGDDPLKGAINAAWPPIDRTEQALTAVEEARASVEGLQAPNVAVTLRIADALPWIERALGKQAPELKNPRIEFGAQQIVLEADFEKVVTDQQIAISGRLLGRILVGAGADAIILTPAFLTVHVDKVKYKGGDTHVVAPLVNAALREYIDNVNGQIKPVRVALGLSRTIDWNIAEKIENAPGVTSVEAPDIKAQIVLARTSVLVDPSGVHALALAVVSHGRDVVTEEHIREICSGPPASIPEISCASGVLKPLCEVEKAARHTIASTEDANRERLCKTLPADVARARIEPRTNHAFEEHFNAFRSAFLLKRESVTGRTDFEDRSQLAINRTFIAQAINEVLAVPAIRVSMAIAPPTQQFSQDVLLAKAPDLKCRENQRSCDIQQDCSLAPCDGWPCDYNCKWYQADCHARKAGCEINKATVIKACQASEGVKKALCETDKSAKKLDCERLKGMEIAGCEINQGWLNDWSEHKVGKIDGKVDASGEVDGQLQTLSVGEDLSFVEVGMSLKGTAKVGADLSFVPANLGNLACQAKWSGHVRAAGIFREENLSLRGEISFVNADDTRPARIVLHLPEREVQFQVVPPPFQALVSQNPDLLVVCMPAVIGFGLSAQLQSAFGDGPPPEVTGLYAQKVGPFIQEISLNQVVIEIPDATSEKADSLTLTPSWTEKAAVFLVHQ